jgi:hypothetical protein
VAILEKVKSAGEGLEAKYGVRPQLQIGLNSGPAVVMSEATSPAPHSLTARPYYSAACA